MKGNVKAERTLPIRMTQQMYSDLQKLSFDNQLPMAEIIRNAIKKIIESQRSVLT